MKAVTAVSGASKTPANAANAAPIANALALILSASTPMTAAISVLWMDARRSSPNRVRLNSTTIVANVASAKAMRKRR